MPSIILRQANVVIDPEATIKGSPLLNSEIDNNFANINISIGTLNNLTTQGKSNVVISINEVTSNIGNIAALQTSNTANLVSAINEIKQNVQASVTVDVSRLVDNSITSAKLAFGSIVADKIANSNVTTSKLADNSITTSKISDNTITTSKIVDYEITSSKIANNSITSAKLDTTGVTAALYGNATRIPSITVGSDGRITSLSNVEISGAGFTNLNAENISTGILVPERGGTGQNSWTTGQILYASATNILSKLAIGSSGQILSVSAGGIPAWINSTTGVTSVQLSGGTTGLSVTGGPIVSTGTMTLSGTLLVSHGGTGTTSATYCSLTSNVAGTLPIVNGGTGTSSTTFCDLTNNVTGTLPVNRGGTGFDSYSAGQLLYASGSTTLSKLGIGGEGTFLKVIGGVPAWGSVTGTGITSLGITSTSGNGITIQSDVGSPITSTGTLSLSFNQSNLRSYLGLGTMAYENTGSYATTSYVTSQGYITSGSLSNYAQLTGATFSGLVTFNGGVVSGSGSGSAYNFESSTSFYSIYKSGSSVYINAGGYYNPSFRSYMSGSQHLAALHNSTEAGMNYDSGTVAVGVGFKFGAAWTIYNSPQRIESTVGQVDKPGGGAFGSTSDARLKENISPYTKGLSAINSLNPKYYNYNNVSLLGKQTNFKTFVGLIAQEVEETVLSGMVSEKDDGYKTIDPNELTYAMINSIKELSAEIALLKQEINALKNS